MSIFGNRMKWLRDIKGETQNQVAKALGKSRESVKKYEKGERQPDIEYITNLAKYYNVSADYILGLTDMVSGPEIITEKFPDYKRFEGYLNDMNFWDYIRFAVKMYDENIPVSELESILSEIKRRKSQN